MRKGEAGERERGRGGEARNESKREGERRERGKGIQVGEFRKEERDGVCEINR